MANGSIPSNGWKEVDHKTGSTQISLSGITFGELLIVVKIDGGNNLVTAVVPRQILASANMWVRMGGYSSGTTSTMATVYVTTDHANIVAAFVNATDKTSASILYVYYR